MSETKWYTRVGDDAAEITATLRDGRGKQLPLDGVISVQFVTNGLSAGTQTDACAVENASKGLVSVSPTYVEAGEFDSYFLVTFGDSSTLSFPTDDELTIVVRES